MRELDHHSDHNKAFSGINGKQPIIFCDFDGTITETDNIVSIMEHFNPPGWQEIAMDILHLRMSIREGVGRLFGLLPSSKKREILDFVLANARIRNGFADLLDFCREHGIRFYVASGGIDFFVYPLLAPFQIETEQIFCNGSDFSGESIEIVWLHPCDEYCDNGCGMCKSKILRSYPGDRYYRIVIGDSVTDFEAAKLADLVFARSRLVERCREMGHPFVAFNDFHDIVEHLSKKVVTLP
ncbi:2-hydroxy-3-keto-5-methylthiopentenyl-1-phosphate phosphatase [Ferviditalea candida]|uniref:2-hydroxy-3-keto-5-methylthiopentenyl-1-phosphate phosphatase n=1 Tax=Ferviditalea candida TaxID=3108399 RepID=A0ABU5ZGI3_9BACL|nr:2-hydroxy-3-keto-5-methylthiopentenyl-1-phosphate phosphatase [Paenibacillaceae bacterium T2]